MPQIFSIGIDFKKCLITLGSDRMTTPSNLGSSLATLFANFASVFVGAMPILTGTPIQSLILFLQS